jgi:hypothetical protein
MDSGTDTYSMPDTAPPRGFAAWQDAWHNLSDNPIAEYLLLAEYRRQRRAQRQRNIAYFLTAVILAALWFVMLAGITSGNSIDWRSVMVWGLSYLVLLYVLWLIDGVFHTVRDALQVLAPPTKQAASLALDDTLAVSGISDEEVVLGVLRILWPPLWWRGLVGSVVLWLVVMVALTEGGTVWNSGVEKVFVLLPVGVSLTALASGLGALALILFYLSMSQALPVLSLSTGGIIAVLVQLAWMVAGPALAFGEIAMLDENSELSQSSALGLGLLGLGLGVCLICIAAARGRYMRGWRAACAVAGPWFAPFLLGVLVLIWQVYLEFDGMSGNEVQAVAVIIGYFQAWGNLLPLNSGALYGALFTGIAEANPAGYWQLLRIPLGFLFQLGLIAVLAWAARDSVRRRRTEGASARG